MSVSVFKSNIIVIDLIYGDNHVEHVSSFTKKKNDELCIYLLNVRAEMGTLVHFCPSDNTGVDFPRDMLEYIHINKNIFETH